MRGGSFEDWVLSNWDDLIDIETGKKSIILYAISFLRFVKCWKK